MKKIQRYSALIWFIGLSIFGLLIRYLLGEDSVLWDIWSAIDTASAVALAVLAFVAYRDIVRDDDEVQLLFNIEGKKVDTGLCLLRKDCTRGEVIGVISMLARVTDAPFKYNALHIHDLLDEINQVQKGTNEKLYIVISKDEFAQFKMSKSI